MNSYGLSSSLGQIGSSLGDMLAHYQNPASAASPYLDRAGSDIQKYYNPYIQAGAHTLPFMQSTYSHLVDSPYSTLQQIGSHYQQSPGFQYSLHNALNSIQNSQAASGMAGSPQDQMLQGKMATNLTNQDYGNYMQRALGLYGTGLHGLSGINKMGYDASDKMAQNLSNIDLSRAQLAYEQAAQQNVHDQSGIGSLIGTAAAAIPYM